MSDATHTPGPWIVDASPPYRPCSWKIRAKAEKCDAWIPIADVYVSNTRTDANAALIARAPDLLAELDKERALVEEASGTIAVLHSQLAQVTAERDRLKAFALVVERSACLQQFNNERCICFACEARRLLIAALA